MHLEKTAHFKNSFIEVFLRKNNLCLANSFEKVFLINKLYLPDFLKKEKNIFGSQIIKKDMYQ